MIDINTASREEMLEHAKDVLGLKVDGRISKGDLKELLAQNLDQAPSAGLAAELGPLETKMLRELRKQKKVEIRIFENKDHPARIPVSINGVDFSIKPGVWVAVPESVVEVLSNAQESSYSQEADESGKIRMVERRGLAFPFEQRAAA